jgi:hypothetical protein
MFAASRAFIYLWKATNGRSLDRYGTSLMHRGYHRFDARIAIDVSS